MNNQFLLIKSMSQWFIWIRPMLPMKTNNLSSPSKLSVLTKTMDTIWSVRLIWSSESFQLNLWKFSLLGFKCLIRIMLTILGNLEFHLIDTLMELIWLMVFRRKLKTKVLTCHHTGSFSKMTLLSTGTNNLHFSKLHS